MSKPIRVLPGIFVFILSCGVLSVAQADDQAVYQSANMHEFPTGPDIAGAGTLTRTKNAVWAGIATTGLDTDSGYTAWWVVFNNPDACIDGCGLDDLLGGDPDVDASLFYAAGFLTGADDIANVVAHLEAGALPEGVAVPIGEGLAKKNGFGAEIHVVLRTHGDLADPGSVADQISLFDACDNGCANQQAVVFPAVEEPGRGD